MTDNVKIRTKFRPDQEIEVSESEALDLKRMNVVYEGEATTDEGARRAVERQQAAAVAGTPRPARKRSPRKKSTATASPAPGTDTSKTPSAPSAPATPQES